MQYNRELSFASLHWKETKYLHLTLRYFGPTSPQRINKIINSLKIYFESINSFNLTICKIGLFGSRYAPSSLWWGIQEEEYLHQLRAQLEIQFQSLGIKHDRQNFVPHITLARIVAINSRPTFQKQIAKMRVVNLNALKISSIELLEAKQNRTNEDYFQVYNFQLK
jgi:2'-5' RNA ligase